jgi:hypothetical protein
LLVKFTKIPGGIISLIEAYVEIATHAS